MADIQPKELEIAIMKLKANKSPRTDDYTAEWYETLKRSSAPLLLRTGEDMARRLENVLLHIIHLDRTGFIQQRQTSDNIRLIQHVIHHIKKRKCLEAVILGLDAEKAFLFSRLVLFFIES